MLVQHARSTDRGSAARGAGLFTSANHTPDRDPVCIRALLLAELGCRRPPEIGRPGFVRLRGSAVGAPTMATVAKQSRDAGAGRPLLRRHRHREFCDGGPSNALVSVRAYAWLVMVGGRSPMRAVLALEFVVKRVWLCRGCRPSMAGRWDEDQSLCAWAQSDGPRSLPAKDY